MMVSPVDRGEAGGGGGGGWGRKEQGACSGLPVTHLHLEWQRNGLEVHQDGHAFHSRFQS